MKNAPRLEAKTKPLYAVPIPVNDLTPEQAKAEVEFLRSRLKYERTKGDLSEFVFGKELPAAPDLEAAVLGAILMNTDGFSIVADILNTDDFYKEFHQLVYKACEAVTKQGAKVELLSVTNHLVTKHKTELEAFGGPYALVELTNRVASTANTEYHSRIIKQKALSRELIKISTDAIREAYSEKREIFDIYDHVNTKTRANNPKSILRIMTMNDAIKEGLKTKPKRCIIGNLIRERDLTILFGDEGTGKSILAFQIGFAAAEGKPLFNMPDDFPNECKPMKVLIFDFELETDELAERYSEKGLPYNFPDNCFRADMNPDCLDLENGGDKLMKSVQSNIEKHEPDLVVIDNITWIQEESTDGNIATTFMKRILTMQKKQGFTTIIVAHTPKRNTSEELESKHLAGSKGLSNFTKNLIGVSHSKLDPNKRYIKQLKSRSKQKEYFDQVIECALEKEVGSALIEWKFLAVTTEKIHLSAPEQDMSNDEICQLASQLRHAESLSWDEIIERLSLSWHRTTLWRRVEKWESKRSEKDKAKDRNKADFEEELKF